MPNIQFVGGPQDGLSLSSGLGAPFLWTDGKKCYRAPARGRALYRAMGDMRLSVVTSYRFVGNVMGLCACGAFRKRRVACSMCGSEVLLG